MIVVKMHSKNRQDRILQTKMNLKNRQEEELANLR